MQYSQDGSDFVHFFFRVLHVRHAWGARSLGSRAPSAAIVNRVCQGPPVVVLTMYPRSTCRDLAVAERTEGTL